MSVFEEFKQTKDRVEWLLRSIPKTKGDDNRLLSYFWWYELGKDKISDMSANEFLNELATNRLTGAESIRRCRQKLQEYNVELRGPNYKSRKKEAEEVRQEINNL